MVGYFDFTVTIGMATAALKKCNDDMDRATDWIQTYGFGYSRSHIDSGENGSS